MFWGSWFENQSLLPHTHNTHAGGEILLIEQSLPVSPALVHPITIHIGHLYDRSNLAEATYTQSCGVAITDQAKYHDCHVATEKSQVQRARVLHTRPPF
jgi:hypothetical protein